MRKAIKRAFLIFLALLFLFESWLWRETGRAIAWLVQHIPMERFKHLVTHYVSGLSPLATLGVFVIPAIVLLPLKVTAVWLLAKGYVIGGISTVLLAKAIGLGISSFLFALCKAKLLQLRAVRFVYEICIYWYSKAKQIAAPYMAAISHSIADIKRMLPNSAVRRRFSRMRRRAKRLAEQQQSGRGGGV